MFGLEYYVISPREDLYPGRDQKGYHSTAPFVKFAGLRDEAMRLVARTGGKIKYSHSEVGCFCNGDTYYEQHEIEFLSMPVEQLIIAKWILRMLGDQYDVEISFAPKITVGKAGSDMHFHMLIEKDGWNLMVEDGKLSPLARKMIAGILDAADALTAFGNSIPTSYLRLVPHQEATTTICWGDRNHSVVVRVPLGWIGADGMTHDANPNGNRRREERPSKQTVEYRVAGLVVASLRGITMPSALEAAKRLYVSGNIFRPEFKERLAEFNPLPASCAESAEAKQAIFPAGMIESRISTLKAFNDRSLSERLYGNNEAIRELVGQFIHVA